MHGKNNDEWYLLETMHSSKVSVCVSGKDDDEWYKLEVLHSLKTEAWCRDTQSKICSQLIHDGISRPGWVDGAMMRIAQN
jgi:hypothetical protein